LIPRRAGRNSGSGWEDLVLTFADATLPAPPIPEYLRAGLVGRRAWCWSSISVKPDSMYFLEPAVASRHARTVYAAVSHAGHGVNSYGLNVYIVTQDLAIFIQHGWGGVYVDPAKEHGVIARTYLLLRELLEAAKVPAERRAVLMYSDFREVACFFRALPNVILPFNGRFQQRQLDAEISVFSDFAIRSRDRNDKTRKFTSLDLLFAHDARHTAVKETLGRGLEILIDSTAALSDGPNADKSTGSVERLAGRRPPA